MWHGRSHHQSGGRTHRVRTHHRAQPALRLDAAHPKARPHPTSPHHHRPRTHRWRRRFASQRFPITNAQSLRAGRRRAGVSGRPPPQRHCPAKPWRLGSRSLGAHQSPKPHRKVLGPQSRRQGRRWLYRVRKIHQRPGVPELSRQRHSLHSALETISTRHKRKRSRSARVYLAANAQPRLPHAGHCRGRRPFCVRQRRRRLAHLHPQQHRCAGRD